MAPGPEAFDALGNRQGGSCNVASRDSGQRAVNFVRRDNGLNQYAHWWPAGRDYGVYYDDNFNQDWQFPGNGVTMGDGWLAASYDALNRPVAMWSFTYQGTPNVLWFGFDPLGRCVKRWVSGNGVDFYINPATYFNYEGWNLLQEGGNAWGPSRVYVQGNRVDEIVWSYKTATGEQAFHHYDARGHCTLLTDSSANIAEQYEYDAFGHASREQKPVAELGVALPLIEQIVRQGLHSDGNNPEGSHNYSHASVTNYVASQSTLRHQVAVILKTTPEQEKKINQYMDARANKTVDKFNDNCARRVSGALKEAGLGFKSTPIPETVVDHARSTGGAQYGIPKGAPQLGPNLKSFDPRMPTQPPVPELLHRERTAMNVQKKALIRISLIAAVAVFGLHLLVTAVVLYFCETDPDPSIVIMWSAFAAIDFPASQLVELFQPSYNVPVAIAFALAGGTQWGVIAGIVTYIGSVLMDRRSIRKH